MVGRRAAAATALTAGVWQLAGPGWSLVGLGVLLLFGVPAGGDAVTAAGWTWLRDRVAALGRRGLAVAAMAGGLVTVPAGVAVAVGVGAGIVVAGGLLLGLGLLTGWDV